MLVVAVCGCSPKNENKVVDKREITDTPMLIFRDSSVSGATGYKCHDSANPSEAECNLFGVKVYGDEASIIRQLAKAGVLTTDTVFVNDGAYKIPVIKFGGIEFADNGHYFFVSSCKNILKIKSLVEEISKYYGNPDIDEDFEPQYAYYHWNRSRQISEDPYIRVRPIHSEEGGLLMTWSFD